MTILHKTAAEVGHQQKEIVREGKIKREQEREGKKPNLQRERECERALGIFSMMEVTL